MTEITLLDGSIGQELVKRSGDRATPMGRVYPVVCPAVSGTVEQDSHLLTACGDPAGAVVETGSAYVAGCLAAATHAGIGCRDGAIDRLGREERDVRR